MANNYILIQRTELTTSASSITFSNIPQTGYTDLKIVASLRGDTTQNWGNITINGGSTAVSMTHLLNNSNSVISQSYSPLRFQTVGTTGTTGNTFSNAELYIPNYTSSNPKSMSMDGTQESNVSGVGQHIAAGLWNNSSAITSITVTPDGGGNFVAGSSLALYGIAATGTTPVLAKAYGGDVVATDGTYWYHAFKSSGTFTVTQPVTCDVLVVAGGGGSLFAGSGAGPSGGGGAGGFLAFTSQALTAQGYAVTVGAGGAFTTGNDSRFGTLTLVKGGGFGGNTDAQGGTGGSGGGSGGRFTSAGGAATSGQGNAGGVGAPQGSLSAGGGGGAGAAGTNAPPAGAGGAGSSAYSSWGVATSTGQNVSGTRWFAGGGGGQSWYGGGPAAGGNGGGGVAGSGTNGGGSGNGLANTGGGGGGDNMGSTGGSGIVIIRYAV